MSESKIKLSEAIHKLSALQFNNYQLAEHIEEWLMYHRSDPANYPIEEAIVMLEQAIAVLMQKKNDQWVVSCSGNGTS